MSEFLVATHTAWFLTHFLLILSPTCESYKYYEGISVSNWCRFGWEISPASRASSCWKQQPVSTSVSHEDGCILLPKLPPPNSSSFSPAAFCFPSEESRMSLLFTPPSLPPILLFSSTNTCIIWTFFFGHFFCFVFHAELEFIKQIKTRKHMKKRVNTTWIGDLKTQRLGFFRVLSPCFLKERVLYCLGNPVYCCHRCI